MNRQQTVVSEIIGCLALKQETLKIPFPKDRRVVDNMTAHNVSARSYRERVVAGDTVSYSGVLGKIA